MPAFFLAALSGVFASDFFYIDILYIYAAV